MTSGPVTIIINLVTDVLYASKCSGLSLYLCGVDELVRRAKSESVQTQTVMVPWGICPGTRRSFSGSVGDSIPPSIQLRIGRKKPIVKCSVTVHGESCDVWYCWSHSWCNHMIIFT